MRAALFPPSPEHPSSQSGTQTSRWGCEETGRGAGGGHAIHTDQARGRLRSLPCTLCASSLRWAETAATLWAPVSTPGSCAGLADSTSARCSFHNKEAAPSRTRSPAHTCPHGANQTLTNFSSIGIRELPVGGSVEGRLPHGGHPATRLGLWKEERFLDPPTPRWAVGEKWSISPQTSGLC